MSSRRLAPIAYAAVIVAFAVLVAFALARPELPQFQGKAMAARLLLFPIALLVIPASWLVLRRARGTAIDFPWAAATLLALPFVIDLAGNASGLYVDLTHFDDLVHALNPVLGVAGIALLLDRTAAPRWSVWIMSFGLGCAAHIAFELFEYWLLVAWGEVELGLTLADTLSDLGWGMLGAAIGAAAVLRPARAEVPPSP